MDKSLLSGSNTMLLLQLLKDQDMYGYQMIEELRKRSQDVFEMKVGTLYPLLHSLEKSGFLQSYEGGSSRKKKDLLSDHQGWQAGIGAQKRGVGGVCRSCDARNAAAD